jgi:hypothetical protein
VQFFKQWLAVEDGFGLDWNIVFEAFFTTCTSKHTFAHVFLCSKLASIFGKTVETLKFYTLISFGHACKLVLNHDAEGNQHMLIADTIIHPIGIDH